MASRYSIEATLNLIDGITRPLEKIGLTGNRVSKTLTKQFAAAEQRLNKFGENAVKAMDFANGAIVGAVTAFAAKGVKDAMEYSTALAKISTIADTSAVPLERMSKDIMALSSAMGVGVSDISASVYEAISAGVDTSKAVGLVEVASKAAVGGFTDTSTAIDGLTSVLNAYGLQTEKATAIANQMMIAQNLGKTTFGNMASTMGQVIPTAAALNVKTEELFSSVAALTANAIQTPQAMTGLKAALSNIQKPTASATKVIDNLNKQLAAQGKATIDFSAAGLQQKGLARFLEDIKNATGGDQTILAQLFGSTEALNAVNVLIGSGSDLFQRSIQEMTSSVDTLDQAFSSMMDTPEMRWQKAMNTLKNAGINLGIALLPIVEQAIEKINAFADKLSTVDFSQYQDAFQKGFDIVSKLVDFLSRNWEWIIKIGIATFTWKRAMEGVFIAGQIKGFIKDLSIAIPLVRGLSRGSTAAASAFNFVSDRVKNMTQVMQGAQKLGSKIFDVGKLVAQKVAILGAATATKIAAVAQKVWNVAMSLNPIGLVITAIGLLIAGVVLLVKNWDKLSDTVKNVIRVFTGPFGVIISVVTELIDSWGLVTAAFQSDGIIAGIKRIGGVLLSGLLHPIQSLLELLAKIPGVDKLLKPALDKLEDFRNSLKGIDTSAPAGTTTESVRDAALARNIRMARSPATNTTQAVTNVVPVTAAVSGASNLTNTASAVNSAMTAPRLLNLAAPIGTTGSISSAALSPVAPPMTQSEQLAAQQVIQRQIREDRVIVEIQPDEGLRAVVIQQPVSPNIELVVSGAS